MSRPEPIEYAERLYAAIRDANFSPISFLAFGNAVKEGLPMRSMPRIAAEPFMRVVGEMLQLEEQAQLQPRDAELVVNQADGQSGTSRESAPLVAGEAETNASAPLPTTEERRPRGRRA
jgi:hypothetical protein